MKNPWLEPGAVPFGEVTLVGYLVSCPAFKRSHGAHLGKPHEQDHSIAGDLPVVSQHALQFH